MAAQAMAGGMKATRWIGRNPALAAGLAAAAAMVVAPAAAHAQGWAPGFTMIPQPLGAGIEGPITMARDGTAIGGRSITSSTAPRSGFTITPQGGTTVWQGDSRGTARVSAISSGAAHTAWTRGRRSADGTVVQFAGIAANPGSTERAWMSLDGNVVASYRETWDSNLWTTSMEPAVWTPQGGTTFLGLAFQDAAITRPEGMSSNGTVVVGSATRFAFDDFVRPWTWTASGGYTLLPSLPGASIGFANASATNFDGSVVVGASQSPGVRLRGDAVRWRNGEIQMLTPPPEALRSSASGVTDDGLTVIGTVDFVGQPVVPSVWREETGWIALPDFLRGQGVNIPPNYFLGAQFEISGDGQTFAGAFRNTSTNEVGLFVAVIPTPGTLGVLALVGVVCTRRARVRRGFVVRTT
jgi:hypothetical protein